MLMPTTEVYFDKDDDGSVPVLDWLLELRDRNERAAKKCFALVKLLRDFGSELRRPRADLLRDGVYELRTEVGNVNYRILYGIVGKDLAVLACGLTKEKRFRTGRSTGPSTASNGTSKTPASTALFMRRNRTMAKTSDAVEILKRKTGIDPDADPEMLQIAEDYRVAQMIYDARHSAGLTQQELADAIGTTQSVISQLEDADYEGHSLSMLRRIAAALHLKLRVELVAAEA